MHYKNASFLLILILLWMPCAFVMIYHADIFGYGNYFSWSKWFVVTTTQIAPLILNDSLSFVGQIVPAFIIFLLSILAPDQNGISVRYTAAVVICCLIGWASYMYFSISLKPDTTFYNAIGTILEGEHMEQPRAHIESLIESLTIFSRIMHLFYMVIGMIFINRPLKEKLK